MIGDTDDFLYRCVLALTIVVVLIVVIVGVRDWDAKHQKIIDAMMERGVQAEQAPFCPCCRCEKGGTK